MQLSTRRRALIVWVGAIALVALVGLWLRPGPTAARAGSPPPEAVAASATVVAALEHLGDVTQRFEVPWARSCARPDDAGSFRARRIQR